MICGTRQFLAGDMLGFNDARKLKAIRVVNLNDRLIVFLFQRPLFRNATNDRVELRNDSCSKRLPALSESIASS
jgi:hypothetical protein